MAVITLSGVTKSFGSVSIIKGVDLSIGDGEFVIFVGPSGSGKSTLLRLIAGLEETSGGHILIDGTDVTDRGPAERALSMVFQSYALYPTKTVRQNMSFGLEVARLPRAEIDRRVDAAAAILKLEPYMARKPRALSGGQRQRVAIGRAIVREPVAFLFDEPLSNLDAALRVDMRVEIAKLHRRLAATMVYVTHDQVEAMTLADKIVVLDGGVIQQVGSPMELYERPANLFVAQFIGSPKMNVLPASADGRAIIVPGGKVRLAAPPPAMIAHLGARPENIVVTPPGQGDIDGRVDVVERLGSDTFAYVAVPDAGVLTVRIVGNDVGIAIDQPVGLAFDTQRLHLFDTRGQAVPAAAA
ncbi:MAG: sn-glycerol-3-phosphate ABC transporter ATP-binding protein UgpC [Bosea sp.]|nr:sn-glycerol-3-phosphate ABC transporter ATP-binding protein UgpC [Bosea sp. (in: a-proteobacteria)]